MGGRQGNTNASKRQANTDPVPGRYQTFTARHERAIAFIEEHCQPPKGYGANEPLKLATFQKDWLEQVSAEDINAAAMSVGRGNGKSTFLAAVATWATFDPDAGGAPQVPIVATTVNQAVRSVYGVALAMIRKNPELEQRAMIYSAIGNMRVYVPGTAGEMFPVSNDPDGLQGLDPSLAVCDEIGFMPIESWDSLLLASGKRPRSLVVGIGTPGFDKDNALWHLRSRVMEGVELPGFYFTEYAAPDGCDIRDEAAWRPPNPALDEGYMNLSALRTAVAISPEAHFRIFRLGQWVEGTECWLGTDGRKVWDALRDPYELSLGAKTWVGIDVGLKRDSTAVVLVQRRPDDRLHATVRVWIPVQSSNPDNARPVDVTDVMQYLREVHAKYKLVDIAYDPRFFDVPAKMLYDEGLPMLEVPQSIEYMMPAVGDTLAALKRGEVSHDGDEVFTTHVLNAIPRYNERGFTLAKSKSRGRIDAAVALCLAVRRALQEQPKPRPLGVWV